MKRSRQHRETENLSKGDHAGYLVYALLGIVVLAICALRYRLLDFPLERDEGGFSYMAKLILQGIPPYTQAYDFKPPGLYLMYAVFLAFFGQTAGGVHTGLLVMNAGTMIMLFLLARKWLTSVGALIAVAVYGILSLGSSVLGFAAHATHFVVFWMLLGYLLLTISIENGRKSVLFLSGIALGLAVLMKQPGLMFLVPPILVTILPGSWRRFGFGESLRREGALIAGAFVPVFLAGTWLAITGAFRQFVFWTYQYGTEFGTRMSLPEALTQFTVSFPQILGNFTLAWVLAGVGLLILFADRRMKQWRFLLVLFALFSFAAVGLGFEFRSHYFVMLLPAVGIFAGYSVEALVTRFLKQQSATLARTIAFIIPAFVLGYGVVADWNYFFLGDLKALSRQKYFPNLFADSPAIADFIRSRTNETDRVAVLGSEPQILFLADRMSASGYLFMYFFMEPHENSLQMQKEMIGEVERASPKMIVYINQQFSWGTRPKSERHIFTWASEYIKNNYQLAGIVDVFSPTQVKYVWGEDAKTYPRLQSAAALVFQRPP